MVSCRLMIPAAVCTQVVSPMVLAQGLPREQWGAPPVSVSHKEGVRMVEGRKNKVALLEMTNQESPDKNRRKERSTFADGVTVTIDRDARTFEVKPALEFSQ